MRNKRGVAGVIILVFFVALASFGPLLAPYDPVHSTTLAGHFSRPIWFKYIFPGNQDLSENFELLAEPGFNTRESLLDEWKFQTNSTSQSVSLDYNSSTGSAAIVFKQGATEETNVEAVLYKEFYYPYRPPKRFSCPISLWIEGTESEQNEMVIPVKMTVFIEKVWKDERNPLWSQTFYGTTSGWLTLTTIDSAWIGVILKYGPASHRVIFPEPGNYIFGVQALFMNSQSETGNEAETTVYVDDLNVKLYGEVFGLLGTDFKGRDIFSQFLYGARISIFVGLLSAVIGVSIGLLVGLISGFLSRTVDEIMMRFADMLLVLPGLPLLIVLVAVLGPSIWNIILIIGFLGWMGFARVIRSQVLSLKERPFIEAAKAVGAGKFYIIMRHLLPNVVSLTYVSLATAVPVAILSEAALSWLGLFDPSIMTWGRMLHDAQSNQGYQLWWWVIPPGIGIAAVSLSFILLGYALDEIFNPKLRIRR